MVDTCMKKKTLGRRKIEIKKIEKRSNLQVTFTKRRNGLFKKADELSILCGAKIAILVQSPAGKIYSFGKPSVDELINSFFTAGLPPPPPQIIDCRKRSEEAAMRLEREKKKAWELHQLEECLKLEREKKAWELHQLEECLRWEREKKRAWELHQLEESLKALQILTDQVLGKLDQIKRDKN